MNLRKTSALVSRLSHRAITCLLVVMVSGHMNAKTPLRIMPLGDSITAGFTNGDWSEPFGFGYRSVLFQRLTATGYDVRYVGKSGQPWNYHSAGVPKPPASLAPGIMDLRAVNQDSHAGYAGKDAAFLNATVVSTLAAENPDVILLMIGINGIPQASEAAPAAAIGNLDRLVQAIVKTRPGVRLIVAQITPYSVYTDAIVQYNRYIRDTLVPGYTKQGYYVTTVDLYAGFLKNPADPRSIDPALFAGWTSINHPGGKAYSRMAETWFEGIRAALATR